jgi:hypothetical protein
MILQDFDFGDLSLGFTWLLRLSRVAKVPVIFLGNFAMSDKNFGSHLSENSYHKTLQFSTAQQFSNTRILKKYGLLTPDSTEFFNIGVTALPGNKTFKLFCNGKFVTPELDQPDSWGRPSAEFDCFSVGSACGNSDFVEGTVKVVAVANQLMTEAEINRQFQLFE